MKYIEIKNLPMYRQLYPREYAPGKLNEYFEEYPPCWDLVPDFDIFIDCGPGVLNSEAWHLREAKKDVEIIGYEPSPSRYANIKDSFPGKLKMAGVYSSNGYKEARYQNNMINDMGLGHRVNIQTIRLDDDVPCENKKVFIWADIEQFEIEMLKGCVKMLASNVVGINLEVWPDTWDEIYFFLKGFNFTPIYRRSAGWPKPVPLFNEKAQTDVLFIKEIGDSDQ